MVFVLEKDIRNAHLAFAENRGLNATYCPSEVARDVFNKHEWRVQMGIVRAVADQLVNEGKLVTMQKGKVIEDLPSKAKGPIRLRKNG